jgi:hypothetical protein
MLFHLKELIFGLGSYEKVRIDIRFLEIENKLNSIEIKKKEDFELLEECIFKIKELLRIKSSNLNKVIKDPKSPLTKKKVLSILEKLNTIKYSFLEEVFKIINLNENEKESFNKTNIENKEEKLNLYENETYSKYENNNLENINKKLELKFDEIEYNLSNLNKNILNISFKQNQINLIILSEISSILFNKLKAAGTNIIFNYLNNDTKIILRYINDELNFFKNSKFEGNLNEIYKKLESKINYNKNKTEITRIKTTEENYKVEKIENNNINSNNIKNESKKEKYLEINSKEKLKKLEKVKENLEELLNSKERKKEISNLNFTEKLEKNKKDEKIELEIENEKIEIEKKNEPYEIDIIKEKELKPELTEKDIEIEKNENNVEKKEVNNEIIEIYSDSEIIVFFEKESKFPILNIKNINEKKFYEMNENEISYIQIFSKIFSSIIFEKLKLDGTNIIFDYNNNVLKVIPRFIEDNLNLKWKGLELNKDTLNQIRENLISVMNLTIINSNLKNNVENVKIENKDQKITVENEQNKDEIKKKADYILKSLKRIP